MQNIVQQQRTFFNEQQTKTLEFRKNSLKRIKQAILDNEQKIIEALKNDLGRPTFETFISEIYQVLEEIKFMLKHLNCLAKTKRVSTPLPLLPSKSYILQKPYGVVLIMAPWNFPFQLCMIPLIGAIAAGNCVIIKPSEYAPHTAQCINNIISQACQKEHVSVIHGDVQVAQKLLQQHFDYIFFTGSTRVGKIIMHTAAEHLTPITLELGGKNCCIVDDTAHIPTAMRRIAWGKFFNAGQNCTAPDYLLVHKSIKNLCIKYLKKSLHEMYGTNPVLSDDYTRIINKKHMIRLKNLLSTAPIVSGGEIDDEKRFITPTLVDTVGLDHPLMQEEIFGPILPIISYTTPQEAVLFTQALPRPLACYIFSNNSKQQGYYIEHIQAGGICINDVILQAASVHLPFGGIGNSGFGMYHGKYSFKTFSRLQSYVHSPIKFDLPLRYPPYTKIHLIIQKVLRWLVK